MASIKYTSIINSFVSTEGSGGFMTNYVYYTVLVAYTDGRKDIVEGRLGEIKPFLAFAKTPMDYLSELQDAVKGLRNDFNDIVDQKIDYVIDSLYPIPNIQGVNEVDAVNEIIKSGLTPIFENEYPESTPQNGTVRAYSRNKKDFRSVNVRIVRDYPNVKGMRSEEAINTLKNAGFMADIVFEPTIDKENDIVLQCSRYDENKLAVSLRVSRLIPDVKGMTVEEACKMMEEAGVKVEIKKQYTSDSTPGIVINWHSKTDTEALLIVSDSGIHTTKRVNVTWSNMQDSNGDKYSATAQFTDKYQTLSIELTYELGTKSRHNVTQIFYTQGISDIYSKIDTSVFEANSKGKALITLLVGKPFESLPAQMNFKLYTSYGIRKQDVTNLSFQFEW